MLPRRIFGELKEQSKNKKVSLLLGARQVGKTTMLKELYTELSKNNKCLFFDLDIITNYEKVSTYEKLINTLKLNGYEEEQKEFFYLFLDEFQKYHNMTRIMKNVYDNLNNVKIYASGSSSLMIKNQVQESLAGRKKINEIYSLDFEEFLWFKGGGDLAKKYKNIKKLRGEEIYQTIKEFNELLEKFLIYGGYPEVTLKDSEKEKKEVLESIFDLYIKKDLVGYLNMEKILEMKKLIEFLAVNNGQKIKYEEITKITSLSFNEIKRYIEILKESYLIKELKPYYTNKKKELVKIPKIYFLDNGVRNYFINNYNKLSLRDDKGLLFEGFIISELIKQGNKNLRFWQDKNFNEVDIILEKEGGPIPVEVKFKKELKSEDFKGLEAFMKAYPKTRKDYLINLNTQKKSKRTILLLPYSLSSIN